MIVKVAMLADNVDFLTGLLNRRSFVQRLELAIVRARRDRRTLTLALCDLDNFKRVNREHGHLTGDEILKDIATRMQTIEHPEALLGRLGGDEYAVVLPGSSLEVAKELVAPFRALTLTRLTDVSVMISYGFAELIDGETAEALIRRAGDDRRGGPEGCFGTATAGLR